MNQDGRQPLLRRSTRGREDSTSDAVVNVVVVDIRTSVTSETVGHLEDASAETRSSEDDVREFDLRQHVGPPAPVVGVANVEQQRCVIGAKSAETEQVKMRTPPGTQRQYIIVLFWHEMEMNGDYVKLAELARVKGISPIFNGGNFEYSSHFRELVLSTVLSKLAKSAEKSLKAMYASRTHYGMDSNNLLFCKNIVWQIWEI